MAKCTVIKSQGGLCPTMSEASDESDTSFDFPLSGLQSTLRKAQHHL